MSSRADDVRPDPFTHEQVVFCHDRATGLRAIIAIYSTALGPALGGTRFYPYATEDAALADVLNLSRGMAYKNALAGLDHGGGKAVIIGDPATDKTEALLRAYGRFVESPRRALRHRLRRRHLRRRHGRRRAARPASSTGRSVRANGGAGDSSVLTAYGVFQGMRAARRAPVGQPDPGRPTRRHRRCRQGRPPPGRAPAGGRRPVVVTDVQPARPSRRCAREHPEVEVARGRRRAGPLRRWTSTRPARSAARSTTTPSPR